MGRSLRVDEKYETKVKYALGKNGVGSQKSLAEGFDPPISLSTVSNFLNCKPVERENFSKICEALNLEISEICTLKEDFVEEEMPTNVFSATLSAIGFLKQSDISYLLFGKPTTLNRFSTGDATIYEDQYIYTETAIHFKDSLKECDFEIRKDYFKCSYLEFREHNILIPDWETSKTIGIDFEFGIIRLSLTASIPITNHGKDEVKIVQITSEPKTWASNKEFPRLVNQDFRLIKSTEKIRFRCDLRIQEFPKDGVILPPGETYYVSITASITSDMDNEPLFPFERAYIKLLALPELWNHSLLGISDLTINIDRNEGKLDNFCFDLAVTKIIDAHKDKIDSLKSSIFLQENVAEEFIANFSKVEALGRSKLGEYIDYLREQEGKG